MDGKIAVVGLGQMGGAIALRLHAQGAEIKGYDINAGARDRAVADGLVVAVSVAAALAEADIVLTSLPDPLAVRSGWLGDGGVVALARPGALLIELSTIDPAAMLEVAQAAARRELDVIDCPVSGSPAEALRGQLVLIAGGTERAIERAQPVFEAIGQTWKRSGEAGTAKVVKIVNNMMAMGNVLIAAESFALGTAAGIDPAVLYDILSVSGGRSHHFTKRFPNALKGNFDPGFKMELGEKDLALGIELGRSLRMPTPGSSVVREMFSLALANGLRGRDIVALLSMYQTWGERGSSAQGVR